MSDNFAKILDNTSELVAPRLLGCLLVREIDGHRMIGRIVETEAYDQNDSASHSYKGQTPRTKIMFGAPGYLYVYFTYGMHYCCNVVVGPEGYGSAVLIRALEPLEGTVIMQQNRKSVQPLQNVTNGPAKLCQALQIDKRQNGHDLRQSPLRLLIKPPMHTNSITQTTRIGISQAKDAPLRFYETGNPYVSKP